MSDTSDNRGQQGAERIAWIDDSVEGHKVRDTGEVEPADEDSVEGHAVNHRPLDNGLGGHLRMD